MIKVGLIGCGFFAVNQMQGWADAEGPASLRSATATRTGWPRWARASASRSADDAARMMREADLDVVDIATTVPSHRPLVTAAAEARLHAICQKPFAETLEDARAMVAAMERAGRVLMVHENFRWQSPIRAVLAALREDAVGRPFFGRVSFRSGYDVFSGQPYLATDPRFIIQDLGIHILDIARALFGEVDRLSASTARVNPAICGEDVATILMDHAGGVTSLVDCSYATRRDETFPRP
ncbi:Gfo/Idh/MocA family oxidoreductase [Paracoccus marcusii]|uniref:Gfo/Idh/MocA family protein n=1 Tax=Paracoccus marcusii TaxID=59779 RepID=UPI002ED4F5C6|nr:Gfo/Idh/MocA family oxidoreductase [Paracoccus marcusii]